MRSATFWAQNVTFLPGKNFLAIAVFTAPSNISISQVQYYPLLQEGYIEIFAFFFFEKF